MEAVPSIGFVHRGLEKLVEKKEFTEYGYVAERICGICSFMHGRGYREAVEHIMNIEIPPRAQYLRTICVRCQESTANLLWLGFGGCLRVRKPVHAVLENPGKGT